MSDVLGVGLRDFAEDDTIKDMNSTMTSSEVPSEVGGLFSLLTIIGTSLSLVGVVLTFITYSLFSDLRTLSGTSLLNFLAAVFLAHLVMVVGVERSSDNNLCLAVGFLLNYMWLSSHCWLLVLYRDMYHIFKGDISLQPASEQSKSFLKCAVFSWGFPALCGSVSALIHFRTDLDITGFVQPTCWILGMTSLVVSYIIPLILLFVSYFYYFVKSVIMIRYTSSLQVSLKHRDRLKKKRNIQLFHYVKLSAISLATWICCLVAEFSTSTKFWYAFVLLASLQGFMVSIAYCCNSRIIRLHNRPFKIPSRKHIAPSSSDYSPSKWALITSQSMPDCV